MINKIFSKTDKFFVFFLLICFSVLLLFVYFDFPSFRFDSFEDSVQVIDDWSVLIDNEEYSYSSLPQKVPVQGKVVMTRTLDSNIISDYEETVLMIKSYYSNMTASIDGNIIYSYPMSTVNPIGNDTPSSQHLIPISSADYGKVLTLEVKPSGNSESVKVYPAYLGTKSQIIINCLEQDAVRIIINCISLFCGTLLIIFYFILHKHFSNVSILWLGIFLLCYALWDCTFSDFILLIAENKYLIYMLSYITFSFLIIPWIYFAYTLNKKRHSLIYHVLIFFSSIIALLTFALHVLSIADYHETFFLLDISVGVGAVVSILLLIIDYFKYKDFGKYSIAGSIAFLIFLFLDMFLYFIRGRSRDGLVVSAGLLFFSIFYLIDIADAMIKFVVTQSKYNAMEKAAYMDSLTNIANRRAFDNQLDIYEAHVSHQKGFSLNAVSMIMFDTNNLKMLNDIHGHQSGDFMLIELAKSLTSYFGNLGTVYRIGGDEFVVICENSSIEELQKILQQFETEINQNENSSVNTSYGLSVFDQNQDTNLYSLFARAEEKMYQYKKEYKKNHPQTIKTTNQS